ncbi:MAG: hypothetical protein IPG18_02355 [Saprospiraceae bacterium]|nr:hypothetical protein [Saprospiraceae bacterium]
MFFTPNPQFTGPVDIIYTICDNQNFCVKATAHILVLDNLKLRIRAYLEGALMENGDARASDNRPLMRDDLRVNPIRIKIIYLQKIHILILPSQDWHRKRMLFRTICHYGQVILTVMVK